MLSRGPKLKKIICLWGGPGTGKSTTCAGLFSLFKKAGYNAEMNREYVKDWVWEGRKINEGDQVYITAKQAKKEATYVREGIEVIINDSPLALTTFYGNLYDKYEQEFQACKQIVKQHHKLCKDHGYAAEHFFLKREKSYISAGRLQDEKTALSYDEQIKTFLSTYPINFTSIACNSDVEQTIFEAVINSNKSKGESNE